MKEIDPGDAVPSGIAPKEIAPLTEKDKAVKARLEQFGGRNAETPGSAERSS